MKHWIFFCLAAAFVHGSDYDYNYEITKSYSGYVEKLLADIIVLSAQSEDNVFDQSLVVNSLKTLKDTTAGKDCKDMNLKDFLKQYSSGVDMIKSTCAGKVDKAYLVKLTSKGQEMTNSIMRLDNSTFYAEKDCLDDSCREIVFRRGLQILQELKRNNLVQLHFFYKMAYNEHHDTFQSCFNTNSADLLLNIMQKSSEVESCYSN